MSMIKILYKTAIMLACSIIMVIGVVIEGVGNVFGKLADYLHDLYSKLFDLAEEKKKPEKKQTNIDIPL